MTDQPNITAPMASVLTSIIPDAGDYPCGGKGCTARLERPGVCADCGLRRDTRAHDATLRPSLESIPAERRWATLASITAPEYAGRVQLPTRWLAAAERMLERRVVVLRGASGRGKTTLACALLRAVIDAGRYGAPTPAYWLAVRARYIHALDVADSNATEHAATVLPFVVIDDVGQECGSGATYRADERAFAMGRVLTRRDKSGLRTVITTYATHTQWAELYGDGVARRYMQSQDAGVVVVDLDARRTA